MEEQNGALLVSAVLSIVVHQFGGSGSCRAYNASIICPPESTTGPVCLKQGSNSKGHEATDGVLWFVELICWVCDRGEVEHSAPCPCHALCVLCAAILNTAGLIHSHKCVFQV